MKPHPEAWKYHQMYCNLPMPLRRELVAMVGNEPLSFRVIESELQNKTEAGYEAFEFLKRIGLFADKAIKEMIEN